MSSYRSFKQEKCWSCEFYSGQRKRKDSFFFGESIECNETGYCTKRGANQTEKVREYGWCSKYHRCSLVQAMLDEEKLKKEREQISKEREELQIERNQIKANSQATYELSAEIIKQVIDQERERKRKQEEQRARVTIKFVKFIAGLIICTFLISILIFIITEISYCAEIDRIDKEYSKNPSNVIEIDYINENLYAL